MRQMKRVGI